MYDRKAKNAEIFRDTLRMILSENALQTAIAKSNKAQKLYLEDDEITGSMNLEREAPCRIVVSDKRTLEAAQPYVKAGKKVAVLNFASATRPGGGVITGSSAQEESICRCSTLYPCLKDDSNMQNFYDPHIQAHDTMYNDDIIYTPDVVVFKTDVSFPERMEENNWYKVDVITCAAPNFRHDPEGPIDSDPVDENDKLRLNIYKSMMQSRIHRIMEVAVRTGADVLILGAFGCGAFKNPPEVVADIFKEETQEYAKRFDTIEYAVFYVGNESENYDAFLKAFDGAEHV